MEGGIEESIGRGSFLCPTCGARTTVTDTQRRTRPPSIRRRRRCVSCERRFTTYEVVAPGPQAAKRKLAALEEALHQAREAMRMIEAVLRAGEADEQPSADSVSDVGQKQTPVE